MIKDLTTALMTKFTATWGGDHNTLYNLTNGQMFKERALQEATPPYVVYHIISDVPEWNFCSDFEKVRIQFNLYSNEESSTEIENLYAALQSLFDWTTLTVTGWKHIWMKRELARLSRDPEDDDWFYTVDYEIYLEET
jgi:hypothetical protein